MNLMTRLSAPSTVLALLAGATAAQTNPVVSQGKFLPPDTILPKTLDRIAIDGGTALASYVDADDFGPDKGAVHVIERQPSGVWTQTSKLLPSNPAIILSFGSHVDLDGDVAAIGDSLAGANSGRAWIFRRSAGVWSEEAFLFPPYPYPGAQAASVGVSGSTLIIGAGAAFTFEKKTNTGAIFFYEYNGSSWTLAQGPIFASDWALQGWFGSRVAIDGDRAVVSSHTQAKAYVFERPSPAGAWSEAQKLTYPGGSGSEYATVLDIDGDWIAVGAPLDDQKADDAGAVFLYKRQTGGGWVETLKLMASDGAVGDLFGTSLALRGKRLVVGAYGVNGTNPDEGAVYVFERQPNATWSEVAKLADPAVAPGDQYGLKVAVSSEGEIAVTSPGDDDVAFGLGTVSFYDAETLSSEVASVSLSQGGTQPFDLQAGLAKAGQLYLLVGSVSGTSPGTPLAGGLLLPLNYDGYTAYTLSSPNQAPLSSSFGVLGAGGGAKASFALPAGSDPSLVGVIANHAFVAVNLAAGAAVTLASNAKSVVLVP